MRIIKCKAFCCIVVAMMLFIVEARSENATYDKEMLYDRWEMVVGCEKERKAANYVIFGKGRFESQLDFYSRGHEKSSVRILKKYSNGFEVWNADNSRCDLVEIVGKNLIIFNYRAFKRSGTLERKGNLDGLVGRWKADAKLDVGGLDIGKEFVKSGEGPLLGIVEVVCIENVRLIKVLGINGDKTYSLVVGVRCADSVVVFMGAPVVAKGPCVFFRK